MEVSAFANRARSVHNCDLMFGIFLYIRKAFLAWAFTFESLLSTKGDYEL